MAITSTELRAIQQAVADAFDDDASGELVLTVSGIEIREMADGSGRYAVFANGVRDGREVYRRRLVSSDVLTVDDLPAS